MAGIIKADAIQLGDGVSANNFVVKTNNDGTFTLARGNEGGALTDILTIDANGVVTPIKFNLGRTWQDVTGSRVSGTPYTNTTGLPIQVNAWITPDDSGILTIAIGALVVAQYSTNNTTGGATSALSVEVPPGASYTITASAATIAKVIELRKP